MFEAEIKELYFYTINHCNFCDQEAVCALINKKQWVQLAKRSIHMYGIEYADTQWSSNTSKNKTIIDGLADKLREYYTAIAD